MLQNNF